MAESLDTPPNALVPDLPAPTSDVKQPRRNLREYVEALPTVESTSLLHPQPYTKFTYREAVGLQVLKRRHAALTKLEVI